MCAYINTQHGGCDKLLGYFLKKKQNRIEEKIIAKIKRNHISKGNFIRILPAYFGNKISYFKMSQSDWQTVLNQLLAKIERKTKLTLHEINDIFQQSENKIDDKFRKNFLDILNNR